MIFAVPIWQRVWHEICLCLPFWQLARAACHFGSFAVCHYGSREPSGLGGTSPHWGRYVSLRYILPILPCMIGNQIPLDTVKINRFVSIGKMGQVRIHHAYHNQRTPIILHNLLNLAIVLAWGLPFSTIHTPHTMGGNILAGNDHGSGIHFQLFLFRGYLQFCHHSTIWYRQCKKKKLEKIFRGKLHHPILAARYLHRIFPTIGGFAAFPHNRGVFSFPSNGGLNPLGGGGGPKTISPQYIIGQFISRYDILFSIFFLRRPRGLLTPILRR
jgi:hypothetical protein